jgi:hypothetical protein
MYRWFGVVPQAGEVLYPSFFAVIFGVLCWRCFEDDFLGFLVGVTYEDLCASLDGDFAPKSLLNQTRFGGVSSWVSS